MGRRRAEAERLAVRFQTADAEALPFAENSFDAVLSTFGVMFTPDQARAAQELVRVCRHGGRIGLANWTPAGFIGRMFGVIGRHVPPPAGVPSPARWGTHQWLADVFAPGASTIRAAPRDFAFRYRSPAHFIEVFRTWYGPVHRAFAAVGTGGQLTLEQDLMALIAEFNESGDQTMICRGEYLEVVIEKA